jgi:hypothetical protein
MGLAVAIIYLPIMLVVSAIGNAIWYWLCIRRAPSFRFSIGAVGFAVGLVTSVALSAVAIDAVPPAPDHQQLGWRILISLLLPLGAAILIAGAAWLATRLNLSQQAGQFLAAVAGGAVNGVWGTPFLYALRYG